MPIQYGLISKNGVDAFLPLLPEGRQMLNERGVFAAGAVKDGRACGILVFRADDLTANILYLAVSPSVRRQGISNGLIDFLCKSAWEDGVAVLASFSAADRDDPLCQLFVKRGDFTLTETEDYICRFPCKALAEVALRGSLSPNLRIEPFYSLPEDMRQCFFSNLREDNAEFIRGLRQDRERMLEPLCLCTTAGGAVRAALFCRGQDGDVLLSFACARPGCARDLIALADRLRQLLTAAADRVPFLRIAAVTPESRKLVEALMPGREITARFYTVCWDMNTMGV